MRRLVNGHWNPNEVLVVQPGEKIVPTYIGGIVQAKVSGKEQLR